MNTENENILTCFLKLLKIKFTKTYISKLYDKRTPDNSLFEMSKVLSGYKIKNVGVKLNDKNELNTLDIPFLVEMDANIAIIKKLTNDHAYIRWKERDVIAPIEEFKNAWNGVALLAEKTEETKEPEFKENHRNELFQASLKYASILSIVILFCIGFIFNNLITYPQILLLLLTNMVGVYIGYLLIHKQLHIPNSYADKFCSLLKKGGCNEILDSSAAKFLGVVGWSEIGLSYFISNTLITVLFPQLIVYLALINMCTLLYSFWSVWYQRFRAKQWCPFCLIVQILLWIVFVINLLSGFIIIPQFILTDILLTGVIYVLPFLLISFALPQLINKKHLQWTIKEINELKMKPEVFEALLKQQPHYQVALSTSSIIWGNPRANMLITMITNPHCGPCGIIHKEVNKLLKIAGSNICVQYIFLPFGKELESSNKFLTEVYLSNEIGSDKKNEIYDEWFEFGKYNKEEFFNKYRLETDTLDVETEVNKHNDWVERNNIHATPTILVNGYELPYNYRIDDLIYFIESKI